VTAFDALLAEARGGADRFGHREHVRLAWLAVTRHGVAAAVELIGAGIGRAAPQKYHATLTRAWIEVVARHVVGGADADVEAFLARCPDLLDARLLDRHYRPATLATAAARTGWVPPDLRPL
jgi:hypothetical protein